MKILHTADWHLGKYLEGFSRLDEQREVLDEICQIADAESVDIVLVAGDLFDNFNPSNEASELLFKTLFRLSNQGKRAVIAIAGNHDSPERIDMPDVLARECGILFVGSPLAQIKPLETSFGIRTVQSDFGFIELQLPDYQYNIRLILTPYTNETRLKKFMGEDNKDANLRQFLEDNWQGLAQEYCNSEGVNILVSHLYFKPEHGVAPEEPDDFSEKSITVGGAQAIFTENIPKEIQYVALGHLHRFQDLGTENQPVIYCGSPLAFSFSEANQPKFVSIIGLKPNENAILKKINLTKGFDLKRIAFENIDEAVLWLSENQDSYVELTIFTENYLKSSDTFLLKEAHKKLVRIIPVLKNNLQDIDNQEFMAVGDQPILKHFEQFYHSKKAIAPSPELLDIFNEAVNRID